MKEILLAGLLMLLSSAIYADRYFYCPGSVDYDGDEYHFVPGDGQFTVRSYDGLKVGKYEFEKSAVSSYVGRYASAECKYRNKSDGQSYVTLSGLTAYKGSGPWKQDLGPDNWYCETSDCSFLYKPNW